MVQRLRARGNDESGAIIVLFALVLVVLFAFVAMAVDLSRLFHQRQVVQNAVDFGSLAGAQDMPAKGAAQGSLAVADALKVTLDNAPLMPASSVVTSFRCVVSDNGSGGPTNSELGIVCGPSVPGAWTSGWTPKHNKVSHLCDPFVGDMCNTIVVSASSTVPYYFAPVIGIKSGSTGAVQAASCNGACGNPASPLDVALVLDRTASMTAQDLANAKTGALALLEAYDPNVQHVALVVLPYGVPGNECDANPTQVYPDTIDSDWQASSFSSDYDLPNGTINPNSAIVKMINCLKLPPGTMKVTPGGAGHTDEGDPMKAARDILTTQGRPGVPDVIVFETDGEANQPAGMQPCAYAINQANLAKAQGIDVFTLAYGVTGARCTGDTSGTYRNMWASTYLAAMATNSRDYAPGTCVASENTDGDNYFCEAGKGDITAVFRRIATTTIQHSHLLDL